jgi:hypothetical protein
MIKLSVTFEKAKSLISEIPHQCCHKGVMRHWNRGGNAGVTAQSICWLFCWAKTGMGSQLAAGGAQRVFNAIFNKSFDWFDARVDYKWARGARYTKKDIESELQHRLQEEA